MSDKPTSQNRIREALDRIYDQHPPQVREYLRRYQEDPKSRVFAPLAEAYRRLGRVDEAIGLCIEGLVRHPEFHGGRVALAKCYIDKCQYDKAQAELSKVVQHVPENLLAQRLLGDSCLALGQAHQALHCYKMAIMLAPGDVKLEEHVRSIEESVAKGGNIGQRESQSNTNIIIATTQTPLPTSAPLNQEVSALWEMGPVSEEHLKNSGAALAVEEKESEPLSWTGNLMAEEEIVPDSKKIENFLSPSGTDLEENFQVQNVSELFREQEQTNELTTTTLADLYFSQGQFEKSLLIYEKLAYKEPLNATLDQKIQKCRENLGVRIEAELNQKKIDLLKGVLKKVKTRSPPI